MLPGMADSRTLPDGTTCYCPEQLESGHIPRCQARRAFDGVPGELPDALSSPAVIAQRRALTEARQQAFLVALAESGVQAVACRAADISYTMPGYWARNDPGFAAKMEVAREMAADSLEAEAIRRAREGVVKPVYQGGQLVGEERVYSDTLMQLMLKGARPRRFRENLSAELSGPNGGPIAAEHSIIPDLSVEEQQALRKVLEDAIKAQEQADTGEG